MIEVDRTRCTLWPRFYILFLLDQPVIEFSAADFDKVYVLDDLFYVVPKKDNERERQKLISKVASRMFQNHFIECFKIILESYRINS